MTEHEMTDEPADPVEEMKLWAQSAPPVDGPIPDGNLADYLGVQRMVAILMDDKGRAYHISNLDLHGVQLGRLEQPRSAIIELMDAYNVQDGPNWSAVKD